MKEMLWNFRIRIALNSGVEFHYLYNTCCLTGFDRDWLQLNNLIAEIEQRSTFTKQKTDWHVKCIYEIKWSGFVYIRVQRLFTKGKEKIEQSLVAGARQCIVWKWFVFIANKVLLENMTDFNWKLQCLIKR